MPTPLSFTSRTHSPFSSRPITKTVPPLAMYFTALSSRFKSTCSSARSSPLALRFAGTRISSVMRFESAFGRTTSDARFAASSRATGSAASWRSLASSRERSKRSSTSWDSRSDWRKMISTMLAATVGSLKAPAPSVAADRGDRRAQLVGHVGDELGPHPLEAADVGDVHENQEQPFGIRKLNRVRQKPPRSKAGQLQLLEHRLAGVSSLGQELLEVRV